MASCIRQLLSLYDAHLAIVTLPADEMPSDEDNVSVQVLRRMHGAVLEQMSPCSTVADVNCAYMAVSLAVYGTQELHHYIRTMAAIEVLTHRQIYDAASPLCAVSDNRILTSDYQTIVQHVVTDGR